MIIKGSHETCALIITVNINALSSGASENGNSVANTTIKKDEEIQKHTNSSAKHVCEHEANGVGRGVVATLETEAAS